jgi:hypothetical protein
MANWTCWVMSDPRVMVLAASIVCGCSGGTEPLDPHAGTYGAALWTSEIHGSAPYNYLDVDGTSHRPPLRTTDVQAGASSFPANRMESYMTTHSLALGDRSNQTRWC